MRIGVENILGTNELENTMDRSTIFIGVETVKLSPLIGMTTEMIDPMKKDLKPKFEIQLKNMKPHIVIENIRITFLNRVITELEYFQKEIKANVKKITDAVNERKVTSSYRIVVVIYLTYLPVL